MIIGNQTLQSSSNYAFERTGEPSARARVRQSQPLRPPARLRRRVPAAQRER